MTRAQIDRDADGPFLRLTRPGAAAEIIPITYREAVRLMMQAAEVVLYESGVRDGAARRQDDVPPHFIGAMGE